MKMSTLSNIPLEKVMCPICRGILIQPVTMPCAHVLCLECFNGSMEMANLTCPLCRKRVGGWLRTAKKLGKLVNVDLWDYIQNNFADYVETKQMGEDDAIEDVLEGTLPPPLQLSAPGEIRKEFETCKANLERELQEEERARLEREQEDERIARELQSKLEEEAVEEMQHESSATVAEKADSQNFQPPNLSRVENKENKVGISSTNSNLASPRGPLDVFLRPLDTTRNTPLTGRLKEEQVDRCDSITEEILHFKPINSVPLTPPKTLPDGKVVEVPLIRATPKNKKADVPSCTVTSNALSLLSEGGPSAMEVDNMQAAGSASGDAAAFPKTGNVSPDLFESDEDKSSPTTVNTSTQNVDLPHEFLTEQEYQDYLYAQELQQSFDRSVDRSEGANSGYQFRKRSNTVKGITKKKSAVQRNRTLSQNLASQPTVREAFRRAASKFNQYS
ncbi:hypothetical protein B566_EDAN012838 [Ephemera danica]|nr:hypothetical protein B566_EDAN012838 [Ephemera danica]